jgi:hypothetical protein
MAAIKTNLRVAHPDKGSSTPTPSSPVEIGRAIAEMDMVYDKDFTSALQSESNCMLILNALQRLSLEYSPQQCANAVMWICNEWTTSGSVNLVIQLAAVWRSDIRKLVSFVKRVVDDHEDDYFVYSLVHQLLQRLLVKSVLYRQHFLVFLLHDWHIKRSICLLSFLQKSCCPVNMNEIVRALQNIKLNNFQQQHLKTHSKRKHVGQGGNGKTPVTKRRQVSQQKL